MGSTVAADAGFELARALLDFSRKNLGETLKNVETWLMSTQFSSGEKVYCILIPCVVWHLWCFATVPAREQRLSEIVRHCCSVRLVPCALDCLPCWAPSSLRRPLRCFDPFWYLCLMPKVRNRCEMSREAEGSQNKQVQRRTVAIKHSCTG